MGTRGWRRGRGREEEEEREKREASDMIFSRLPHSLGAYTNGPVFTLTPPDVSTPDCTSSDTSYNGCLFKPGSNAAFFDAVFAHRLLVDTPLLPTDSKAFVEPITSPSSNSLLARFTRRLASAGTLAALSSVVAFPPMCGGFTVDLSPELDFVRPCLPEDDSTPHSATNGDGLAALASVPENEDGPAPGLATSSPPGRKIGV